MKCPRCGRAFRFHEEIAANICAPCAHADWLANDRAANAKAEVAIETEDDVADAVARRIEAA